MVKMKNFSNGYCSYELYEFSKPCEYFCSKPSIFVENCIKLNIIGMPPRILP